MNVIFDLDGTVIDSSHRQATLPNGDLDLAHWFDNATPEKIAGDSLMPLAVAMRRFFRAGHNVIICTARTFQKADHDFLRVHDLRYHALLKREGRFVAKDSPEFADSYHGFIGDARGDAAMKICKLTRYFRHRQGLTIAKASPIMFEDNWGVINALAPLGVQAIHISQVRPIRQQLQELWA